MPLDQRQHPQNLDCVRGSTSQRSAIADPRDLIDVVPQPADRFDERRISLTAREAPARRPQTSQGRTAWVNGSAKPIRNAEARGGRLGTPCGGHAGGETGAERDAQRLIARTLISGTHGGSWCSQSGDRRGCKPLASYAVGAPWGANGIGLAASLPVQGWN
jgi:hypothetical protein